MKDFLNKDIDGHFYEEELQALTKDIQSVYKIEQVLKTRIRQAVKEFFVKWLGWPKKFNSWIKESYIQAPFRIRLHVWSLVQQAVAKRL